MIAKIGSGKDTAGLIRYLFDTKKAKDHTDPHLVASWDGFAPDPGRSDDFDPQFDPVVRIEAHRLRRSLEYFYLTAGKDDPVRISVPKGSPIRCATTSAWWTAATITPTSTAPVSSGDEKPAR